MGLRFRKSINLGGGFRVNLSKSGIGYSWGGKGFRVTKTASGKTRATTSIPGTGISYTQEFGGKKRNNMNRQVSPHSERQNTRIYNNYYDTQEIKNANAKTLVSDGLEEMLSSANKALSLWRINSVVYIHHLTLQSYC